VNPGEPASGAPAPDALLAVARLIRPHGLRGELSAVVLAPDVLDPFELLPGAAFALRPAEGAPRVGDPSLAGRILKCEAIRPHQDRWLVKLEGFDDLTAAEGLRGFDLCLARKDLPPLPEGWHWEADIVGAKVIDGRLGELGIAAELETGGGQNQLIVRRPAGDRVRIPWVKAYLKQVDLARREIRIELPEGFPGIED
jgi:16S rRNA processing protein RimM